jgi:uncharacterized protein YgbK (DUF1537 family)
LALDDQAARLDAVGGAAAVLSGSCSLATQAQVAHWQAAGHPTHTIDPRALARGDAVVAQALQWAQPRLESGPLLIGSTAAPDALRAVQAELGAARAGALVEHALAQLACGLVAGGVRRLVVAGGETSGAVVQALGVRALRIGPAICPGVPWTSAEDRPLKLALKSGNFGGPAFFAEALAHAGGA